MANTLGSLVVKLGLDAAEFTSGMTKAEAQSQRIVASIDRQFQSLKRTLAGLGLGTLAVAWVRDVITSASALDDLSDATGSSVESLSKLANQAKISGTDFATLEGIMLKLAAGMAGVDEEGSKVGEAFRAIGVTAKDPAEAIQQAAKLLNQYADGVGKAAWARDQFGKQGPAFLAALKDIAEMQDVVGTTTTKMAAEAEALEKSWRRLTVEGTLLKNMLLEHLIPALNEEIQKLKDSAQAAEEAGLSFGQAMGAWLKFKAVGTIEEKLKAERAGLAKLESAEGAEAFFSGIFGTRAQLKKEYEFRIRYLERQLQRELGTAAPPPPPKPEFKYTGARALAAKPAVDKITEAERYLKSLQEQLDKTQELTVYDHVLNDLLSGRLELSKGITAQELLGLAQQIDAANQTKKLLEEETKAREQAGKMDLRAQEEAAANVQRQAEANETLRDEIALIGADATKRAELARARLSDSIAAKQEAIDAEIRADGDRAKILLWEQEIRLLRERQGLLVQKGIAEQAVEDAKQAKEFVDSLGLAFASAFEDAIVAGKSFRDILHGIEQDIVRIITRKLVTEPFAAAIGDMLGGSSWSSAVAKNFTFNPFAFGSSGVNFGSYATGPGMPQLGGPGGFASGTNYAPGGWAMVGERGPELINLPRGSQVVPNSELVSRRSARNGVTVNVNVLPGASRATADQAALAVARELTRSSYRNG